MEVITICVHFIINHGNEWKNIRPRQLDDDLTHFNFVWPLAMSINQSINRLELLQKKKNDFSFFLKKER